jgi:hypothetical protein
MTFTAKVYFALKRLPFDSGKTILNYPLKAP